jgi:hypothetical protein
MAILPNEFLSEVCSHADNATLKQLRLVDQTLSSFAAECLFEEVHFILPPESIEKVRQIMEHPTFHSYVRYLIYYVDRLNPKFEDYEVWKTSALHISADAVSADLKTGWDRFCRLLSEQQDLVNDGAEFRVLNAALRRLVNMDSLSVINRHRVNCSDGFEESPYHRIAQKTLLDVNDAFCYAIMEVPGPITQDTSAHVPVLQALHSSGKALDSLLLAGVPFVFWQSIHDQGFAFYDAIKPSIRTVFSKLTDLTLIADVKRMDAIEYETGEMVSLLYDFLSNTPLLEILLLQFFSSRPHSAVGHTETTEVQTDITEVLEKMTWQKLTEVSLNNCLSDTCLL